MAIGKLVFGERVSNNLFIDLLKEKDSKYLTDFKRFFNFLKKNHDDYKKSKIIDKVSIDQPLFDYVKILSDWLEYESEGMFTLYYCKKEEKVFNMNEDEIYFSFKTKNNMEIEEMYILLKKWTKQNYKNSYYSFIDIFEPDPNGPTILAVY